MNDPSGNTAGDRRAEGAGPARRRSPVVLVVLGALFFVLFAALGTWQVERRAWKLDLIARVDQRVHAPAVAAPGPSQWPQVSAATDEYRHVTASGTFLDSSQTLVQAVTDLGAGYWVLTPLRAADGTVVLVNRGFVGADDRGRVQPGSSRLPAVERGATQRGDAPAASGGDSSAADDGAPSTVTGLLRITEPKGAFLRHNNPAGDQWYSRDVQAIAVARGLTHVAPYFIDAEAAPHDASGTRLAREALAPTASGPAPGDPGAPAGDAPVAPTPGLTVIRFHNSHLVYAITWYTLALMTAIGIPLGLRKQ